jgi:glutathione S-transferase
MFIKTLTIINYLDESYPQPPLLPGTARDRAQIRALAELIVSQLHPPINLRSQYMERAKVARSRTNDGKIHRSTMA